LDVIHLFQFVSHPAIIRSDQQTIRGIHHLAHCVHHHDHQGEL
jgi:hypothetical protein